MEDAKDDADAEDEDEYDAAYSAALVIRDDGADDTDAAAMRLQMLEDIKLAAATAAANNENALELERKRTAKLAEAAGWWAKVHAHFDNRWAEALKHPLDIHNPHIAALADDLHVRFMLDRDYGRGATFKVRDISMFLPSALALRHHYLTPGYVFPSTTLGARYSAYVMPISAEYTADEEAVLQRFIARNRESPLGDGRAETIRRVCEAARSAWMTPEIMSQLLHACVLHCDQDATALFNQVINGPLNRHPQVIDTLTCRANQFRVDILRQRDAIASTCMRGANDLACVVLSYLYKNEKPPYIK